MKRFTWWRMEQNAPHNARERWCASCSILHHVKRFMSHSPDGTFSVFTLIGRAIEFETSRAANLCFMPK